MSLFIIIQARMTSTRLPSKVMLPLCNKSVLEVMLERIKTFKPNIIIATTNDGTQKPIVELCKALHVNYYEGSENNVLSRYYESAVHFGAKNGDAIVRLTSDCPLIDSEIIQKVIDFYNENSFEFVSNCIQRTYPRGLDCEIFSFNSLEMAFKNAITPYEKEHVTPYIQANRVLGSVEDFEDFSRFRLTLDEDADYEVIKEVYNLFNNSVDFNYNELKKMLTNHSEIYEINKHIEQKKR